MHRALSCLSLSNFCLNFPAEPTALLRIKIKVFFKYDTRSHFFTSVIKKTKQKTPLLVVNQMAID